MRTVRYVGRFKRDYRRVKSSVLGKKLDSILQEVLKLLIADKPLSARHFDHALSGDWADHRDCHLRPDLILIYRKPNSDTLELVRLGSHSELSL